MTNEKEKESVKPENKKKSAGNNCAPKNRQQQNSAQLIP